MQTGTANSVLSEYVTEAELAVELSLSVRRVDRWTPTGDSPPCVRIGLRSLFKRAAVVEWLKSSEVTHGRIRRKHPEVKSERAGITIIRKRHPNHRRVKIHRSYTIEDIAGLFGAHKNTVRPWVKAAGRAARLQRLFSKLRANRVGIRTRQIG